MYIQICGLSTPETLTAAVQAGADAVGFLLAPGYARTLTPAQVRELLPLVPGGIETVGVFRNQPLEVVLDDARAAGVRTVQLHGDEPAGDVEDIVRAGFGTLRAVYTGSNTALSHAAREGS